MQRLAARPDAHRPLHRKRESSRDGMTVTDQLRPQELRSNCQLMRGAPALISAKLCQKSVSRGEPFPRRALRVFQTPAVPETIEQGTKGRAMNALFQLKNDSLQQGSLVRAP